MILQCSVPLTWRRLVLLHGGSLRSFRGATFTKRTISMTIRNEAALCKDSNISSKIRMRRPYHYQSNHLSSICIPTSDAISFWNEKRYTNTHCFSIPRITEVSIVRHQQHPWLFQRQESFSTTTNTTTSSSTESINGKKEDEEHTSNLTAADTITTTATTAFRQRIQDGKERGSEVAKQGAKVAKKGAHSAKDLIQKYGPVFLGTYLSVYFGTVGGLYVGIESGLLDPAYILSLVSDDGDASKTTVAIVADTLEHYSYLKPYAKMIKENPQYGNLAVAWIATKFTEPLRLAVTAMIVPPLARTLGFVDVVKKQEETTSA